MKHLMPWAGVLILMVAIVLLVYAYMFVPVTTVILVRHAERLNDTDTTSISAAGWERGADLAAAVREAGVTHIFVSEKSRTGQTAAATAERLNLIPSVIPAADTPRLIDSLRAYRGETVLVVAHGNTIGRILEALDIHEPVVIPRDVFDDLLVVTVAPFRSSVARLKYGRPS
jgi:broad specificity phosphatase PhoE